MQFKQQGVWPLAGNVPLYVEDVFSTYLYTGNGSTQTITNGIDLSSKGGLVWAKSRSDIIRNSLFDTARGANFQLSSNTNESSANVAPNGITFGSTGFTTGSFVNTNTNNATYASWTFRMQPKFFDIVTYTGNGTSQTISHNLGSTPGSIFVKRTDTAANWIVYHIGLSSPNSIHLKLNSSNGQDGNNDMVNGTSSTTFSVGSEVAVNASGGTYVAYLFAHNAGGFGALGTDNVISCGSFSVDGAASFSVNLGYEPQWVMIKSVDNTSVSAIRQNWIIYDNMRALGVQTQGQAARLLPNSDAAESSSNEIGVTATGFESIGNQNPSTGPYIYIAIRRGPMKTPTDATTVFSPNYPPAAQLSPYTATTNFPVDLSLSTIAGSGPYNRTVVDRLRGNPTANQSAIMQPNLTNAESSSGANNYQSLQSNTALIDNAFWSGYSLRPIYWLFRRAPSFFDIVCYTGTGANRTVTHNLGVVPEMMIVKNRSIVAVWRVYLASLGATQNVQLNQSNAAGTVPSIWNDTAPTSSVFTVGTAGGVNGSGESLVAYLFATCAGVSKVGSYTGNGTTQTINCGFGAGGARFVLIKRTDATGDWYVYDTARGMSVLTDPYSLLNTTDAEVATLGSVTTVSTGFALNSAVLADINISAGTFIFLAIA